MSLRRNLGSSGDSVVRSWGQSSAMVIIYLPYSLTTMSKGLIFLLKSKAAEHPTPSLNT